MRQFHESSPRQGACGLKIRKQTVFAFTYGRLLLKASFPQISFELIFNRIKIITGQMF